MAYSLNRYWIGTLSQKSELHGTFIQTAQVSRHPGAACTDLVSDFVRSADILDLEIIIMGLPTQDGPSTAA